MIVPRYMMGTGHLEKRHRSLRVLDLAPEIRFSLSYVCAHARQRHLPESLKTLMALIQECYAQITASC